MSKLDRFLPLTLLTLSEKDTLRKEIIAQCDLVADCWVYRTRNSAGYGMKRIAGKVRPVSRFMLAYHSRESMNVPYDACHNDNKCSYRACCNPEHLSWGTRQENIDQREKKRNAERFDMRWVKDPVPGHETHEEHAVWLAGLRTSHLTLARWHRIQELGTTDRDRWERISTELFGEGYGVHQDHRCILCTSDFGALPVLIMLSTTDPSFQQKTT